MTIPSCPKCSSQNTYSTGDLMMCPDCFHEWNPNDVEETDAGDAAKKVLDANGNVLENGDTVVVIKDLPVKGNIRSVKSGTKVKNIKLVDGDHNIDCKIDGFGAMAIKSEFVRKAT